MKSNTAYRWIDSAAHTAQTIVFGLFITQKSQWSPHLIRRLSGTASPVHTALGVMQQPSGNPLATYKALIASF